jgi:hypothetical protein
MAATNLSGVPENPAGYAQALDIHAILTKVASVTEARALPAGSLVGDRDGGLTFPDAVAAALEIRSSQGWREFHAGGGETWTVILLDT